MNIEDEPSILTRSQRQKLKRPLSIQGLPINKKQKNKLLKIENISNHSTNDLNKNEYIISDEEIDSISDTQSDDIDDNMTDENNDWNNDTEDNTEDEYNREDENIFNLLKYGSYRGPYEYYKVCEYCKICNTCEKNNKKTYDKISSGKSNSKSSGKNCKKCKICEICQIQNGKKIYDIMMEDEYFQNLTFEQKINYIKLRIEVDGYNKQMIPVKYKILDAPLSLKNKSIIMDRIDEFEIMNPMNNEYIKLKRWIDGITRIPFGIYTSLPININASEDAKYQYICHINNELNKSIYGQYDAKDKILQIVSQWISNPNSIGNVIALQGPPGIGKTTLIKNGLSNALNKPFNFITLGGANDGSTLEGHSYTYEGSIWGRIADILMQSKCMNPIIFFDELDKLSTSKGTNEIMGILTHLIDASQNNEFHDVYFAGIDFDLSKILFIFSYNDEANVNYILKDRITRIKMTGFSIQEKIQIAKNYLIPSILTNVGFNSDDILINEDVIHYIITKYTIEEGVRKLKECLNIIYNKINLLRFTANRKNIDIKYNIYNFILPFTLTNQLATLLLENEYYHLLSGEDQIEFIKRKEDISLFNQNKMRLTEDSIINLPINHKSRSIILQKFQEFQNLKPDDNEYSKIQNYITGLSKIPFGKYIDIPVNVQSSFENKSNYLNNIQQILDNNIYKQQDAKDKILQVIAQQISNPNSNGNIIALYGPPGTGKTSLIKDGLSQALQKPFNLINLGGATDSSTLKGHSYTYVGATWGRIVDLLIQSQCMNPIIYLDELDKISQTDKGQEIVQTLINLTDTSQNNEFHDIYFQGIDFDLSKVLFIFSYNNEEMINTVLKDRITSIKMSEYKLDDKIEIAMKYMIPKICLEIGLCLDDIIINRDIVKCIINKYTDEKGVRKLKECLNTIYSKINLLKHIDQNKMKIDYAFSSNITFPLILTHDIIYKLLKIDHDNIFNLLYN